ncbi:nitric oxide synthase oxygenase [Streptomyces sp. NBC_01384]|uniref:nitric oxide synthase oxygenase n=1 Tax=Streptomyces sp. NBC_01384 TaxID=2903847 RepID=UPI0032569262
MRDFPRGTGHAERFGDDGSARYPAPWAEGPGGWLDRVPPGRRAHGAAPTAAPPHETASRKADLSVPGLTGRLTAVTGGGAAAAVSTSRDHSEPYELLRAAAEFLTLRHTEERLGDPARRIAAARTEIAETGTYRHTTEELVFGARVAWRNANRCIGRLYWHSLRVRDRRDVRTAQDVAEASADHLREATHDGRIRALITVFAPDRPDRPGPRIWNEQLIRYAGYARPDGGVTGDPRNAGLTALARRLGWPGGPGTPFDVLPLVIQGADGRRADDKPRWFALPDDAVLEVELAHPEYPWWRALGLRWHAVPAVANMCLEIGGVCYPAAPFNGWYMGTEIGARNLADTDRYNLLPHLAERLGLDTRSDRSLWKDRALVELNRSVLHSFDHAGVTVTDHHTESRRFLTHLGREERKGRRVGADWSWIVPPISGSATPVFHRTYEAVERRPAYVHHPEARTRAHGETGGTLV